MHGNWILIRDEFFNLVDIQPCPLKEETDPYESEYIYTQKPQGWTQPGFIELTKEKSDGEEDQHEASRDLLQSKPG